MSFGQEAPVIAPAKGEMQVLRPFNGRDFSGWLGHVDSIWTVQDGEIVARNPGDTPVHTTLLTSVDFADFRFTFEFRHTAPDVLAGESDFHSGVVLWGQVDEDADDEFAYAGHLIRFPASYGIFDTAAAEQLVENADAAQAAETAHLEDGWNKVEVLAQGNRIRFALNGTLVTDWRDPQPDRIKAGPIGLMLNASGGSEEIRFRKLLLELFPRDHLLSVQQEATVVDTSPPELNVNPGAPEIWTQHTEVVIPDALLEPIRHPELGLTTMGFRKSETIPLYAFIEKCRQADVRTMRKAANEFREQRQRDGHFPNAKPLEFPEIVDLFQDKEADKNCPNYHGKLVSLHGHIRRRIWVDVKPEESPFDLDGYYECWLYDRHAQGNPVIIICPDVDESILDQEGGTDIQIDHCYATGYFFKNFGYKAQQDTRFAPLFVAKRLYHREPESSGSPFSLGLNATMMLAVAGVVVLLAGRFGLRFWLKSRAEEQERQDLRKKIESSQGEPKFNNVVDTGNQLQLSAEMTAAADAAATRPGPSADETQADPTPPPEASDDNTPPDSEPTAAANADTATLGETLKNEAESSEKSTSDESTSDESASDAEPDDEKQADETPTNESPTGGSPSVDDWAADAGKSDVDEP